MSDPTQEPGARAERAATGGAARNERDPRAHGLGAKALLTLGALGVVFGDIGTSPLYGFNVAFQGAYRFETSALNVLGILSLTIWSLILVVSLKYLMLVMRADNNGEGGILPLMALVVPRRNARDTSWRHWMLVPLGLFGCSLIIGDGMITPAISVLSALEGLKVATNTFKPYIIPITIGILCLLFAIQSQGTSGIGRWFGPVMVSWFLLMGALGLSGIAQNPGVLVAFSPTHALHFFAHNGIRGFVILGAVLLVMTGAEMLYADMGHFGAGPIRAGWFLLALPALLLNYLGQGAILLKHPEFASSPFFHLAPAWALYPVVILSTVATIIASQAAISGVFSLTMAAVHFGYLPRVTIQHTSPTPYGQIYVPIINWLLLAVTILFLLVLGFKNSRALAAAFGIAVSLNMVITDVFLLLVMTSLWRWTKWVVFPLMATFLLIDLSYFGANTLKIAHGGWVPLGVAGVSFVLMTTWRRGRKILSDQMQRRQVQVHDFLTAAGITSDAHAQNEIKPAHAVRATRIPGTFVYLTDNPTGIPSALAQNFRHNQVLHQTIVLLTVQTVSTQARAPLRPHEPKRHGLHYLLQPATRAGARNRRAD